MKDASQYPVTTGYGYIAGYPLNNGFHKGEDRACPIGTQLKVNGIVIGNTGSTGASTGPHLHLGRWVNGEPTNPQGQGFDLKDPVVLSTGEDTVNGKYIRLKDTQGVVWFYCHLIQINVKTGDKLMSTINLELAFQQADVQWGWSARTAERETILKRDIVGRETNEAINFMFNHAFGVAHRVEVGKWKAEATAPDPAITVLEKGKYEVK